MVNATNSCLANSESGNGRGKLTFEDGSFSFVSTFTSSVKSASPEDSDSSTSVLIAPPSRLYQKRFTLLRRDHGHSFHRERALLLLLLRPL